MSEARDKTMNTNLAEMEIVQVLHAPSTIGGYPCPDYVEALVAYIFKEVTRCYNNSAQLGVQPEPLVPLYWTSNPELSKRDYWEERPSEEWGVRWQHSSLEGWPITFRHYSYPRFDWEDLSSGHCTQAEFDLSQQSVAGPNFQFEDVELRWYKYFGRSMTTNRQMTPDEWVAWFDRCLTAILMQDICFSFHNLKKQVRRADCPKCVAEP